MHASGKSPAASPQRPVSPASTRGPPFPLRPVASAGHYIQTERENTARLPARPPPAVVGPQPGDRLSPPRPLCPSSASLGPPTRPLFWPDSSAEESPVNTRLAPGRPWSTARSRRLETVYRR
ncbi:hypothetical protein NL676_026354 [Syzygium grande]|nr:hypothetical protein NL676_026354 [Syzygium grande]